MNAYEIFCKSRPAFRILQSYLQLPSQQTLTRFVSLTLSTPGINKNVLNALKEVLNGKNETEHLFALVFDEMSIKPYLVYDRKYDNIVGFEDFGNNSRSNDVANQALVLMLRNLTSPRKLPLSFFFQNIICLHFN